MPLSSAFFLLRQRKGRCLGDMKNIKNQQEKYVSKPAKINKTKKKNHKTSVSQDEYKTRQRQGPYSLLFPSIPFPISTLATNSFPSKIIRFFPTQEYLALVIFNLRRLLLVFCSQDMETRKHSNSEISSDPESEQHEKSTEDSTGVGRSYECTFCKRGFTNAQALGGHMNIHRKDKAKAKQKNQEEPSNKPNENYTNLRYFPQISSTDHHQQQTSYYRAVGGLVNYQVYLPSSNPNLPVWRPEHFEGHVDANLSLGIGISPPVQDGEGGHVDMNVKENEVDLELRLGHDP